MILRVGRSAPAEIAAKAEGGPEAVARGPLAVVAGGGGIPAELVADVRATGRPVVLVGIRGEGEPALLDPLGAEWVDWGQVGRMFDLIERGGCKEVILIGSISKRPDFRSIAGDLGTLRRLPRILAALVGGDDSVLTRVIRIFEQEDLTVVGVPDVAPALLAGAGTLGRHGPSADAMTAIATAAGVIEALSPHDVGQAAVALFRRTVAIEGAEGTDGMLERVAALRASGRIAGYEKASALVKRMKTRQDMRADLPTIGPATVERAAAAGLAGIAIESGHVIVAAKAKTIVAADAAGLFLYGFAPADLAQAAPRT